MLKKLGLNHRLHGLTVLLAVSAVIILNGCALKGQQSKTFFSLCIFLNWLSSQPQPLKKIIKSSLGFFISFDFIVNPINKISPVEIIHIKYIFCILKQINDGILERL